LFYTHTHEKSHHNKLGSSTVKKGRVLYVAKRDEPTGPPNDKPVSGGIMKVVVEEVVYGVIDQLIDDKRS